ncbi:hypothetical protein PV08_09365 [Exophiala spinifera]|uniref:Uncharacterized protein n=1 Tax=Exophiala spinifera TaxID=91928 RepID=A0A0D1YB11_9EURO|nr:uncharacterized protein PV08_09365 [Exophiala spinifera]KIW12091.1 hypothetical protein PV08_09365 [Exophiala spinifera]
MLSGSIFRVSLTLLSVFFYGQSVFAQTTTPFSNSSTTRAPTTTSVPVSTGTVPDVYLNVPTLSVGRIELDVDDLRADINLNAQVASLVTLNAGVALSIQKVNLTIADVDANLELIVRLGHLVDIVNRVFESLDLNPLLISAINNVTSLLEPIVGAVDGLLGTITQGGTSLSFLIDNLGNIVQEVGGVSTIVGDYLTNMTYTGQSKSLSGGLTEKTYSYTPLNALVDIVFNTAGQVVQAQVQKSSGGSTSTTASSTSSAPTSSATS